MYHILMTSFWSNILLSKKQQNLKKCSLEFNFRGWIMVNIFFLFFSIFFILDFFLSSNATLYTLESNYIRYAKKRKEIVKNNFYIQIKMYTDLQTQKKNFAVPYVEICFSIDTQMRIISCILDSKYDNWRTFLQTYDYAWLQSHIQNGT